MRISYSDSPYMFMPDNISAMLGKVNAAAGGVYDAAETTCG